MVDGLRPLVPVMVSTRKPEVDRGTSDTAVATVLRVVDLSVYYGDFRALRDVTLDMGGTRSPPSSARPGAERAASFAD